ncbi:MAG: hypothetical protein JJ896_05370 [Rhodothermales bacterium]|nr:hypothetical protein [Rhodothermales bacterium]MBO6779064.1 hypothetical protein [Rhodothermales bacterium]
MTRYPILVLVLIFLGCGAEPNGGGVVENGPVPQWMADGSPAVRLVREQTYGREDGSIEEMLDTPRRAVVDAQGTLYLHDGERLVAFDSAGEVLWQVAAQGEGPGELHRVRGLTLGQDGHLLVTNQSGTRLDRFTAEGSYTDSRPVSSLGLTRGTVQGVFANGHYLMSATLPGAYGARLLLVADEDPLRLVDSLSVRQKGSREEIEAISVGSAMGVVADRIALALIHEYGYIIMDQQLDTLSISKRPDVPKPAPYGFLHNGNPSMIMLGSSFDPLPLAEGRWLGGASWAMDVENIEELAPRLFSPDGPTIEYTRSLDLYDRDGTLLYAWTEEAMEAAGLRSVLASDGEALIWARTTDDVPTVARFRLEIDG